VLQSREAHLQELFEAARGRLEELSKDQSKYQELLTKLVLQVSRRLAAR
jgi:V-type H+-transporting ATPase subunit E